MNQTARTKTTCSHCQESICVGDRITKTNAQDMVNFAVPKNIPQVLVDMMAKQAGNQEKDYHPECAGMTISKSSTGRKIQAPVRYRDENFIKGSGFVGADHWDRGFDGNEPTYYVSTQNIANLKDFVVEDEVPVSPVEIQESDEEVWESGEETEEDEEPDSWD